MSTNPRSKAGKPSGGSNSNSPEGSAFDLSKLSEKLPPILEAPEDSRIKGESLRHRKRRSKSFSTISDESREEKVCNDEICEDFLREGRGWHARNPLSVITNLITCFHQPKRAQKQRSAILLELHKRQQAALSDKQDTIDMLEWQLEQFQAMAEKEHELHESEGSGFIEQSLFGYQRKSACRDILREFDNKENIGFPDQNARERKGNGLCCGISQESDVSALLLLFDMAVIRARLSVRYFCNLFLKQMEASGYSLCRVLAEMESGSTFIRKEHTAFILDSRINKAFYHCFENESFDESGITQILDPSLRCAVKLQEYRRMKNLNVGDAVNSSHPCFEPEFLSFCQTKTKEMWSQFPFTLQFKDVEERNAFTAAFLDVAKGVWLLHRLAFSVHPNIGILRVGRGMEINPLYVEPVCVPQHSCSSCGSAAPKVEFMVMPGFRAHRKIIKCQVYQHVECKF